MLTAARLAAVFGVTVAGACCGMLIAAGILDLKPGSLPTWPTLFIGSLPLTALWASSLFSRPEDASPGPYHD